MNRIDFSEIEDWRTFEDLAADYFEEIAELEENNLTEVTVNPTGEGPDGGRDILLTFRLHDSIIPFERKWVVQCKFYDNLLKSNMDKINIPTLIEEYGANGYLLICKNSVQVGVTNTLENLKRICRNGHEYIFWNGNHFRNRLYTTQKLHEHYFPKFYQYRIQREEKSNIDEILKDE